MNPEKRVEYHSSNPNAKQDYYDLLSQYRSLQLPQIDYVLESESTVVPRRYTYYIDDGEGEKEEDDNLAFLWYEKMLSVYSLFHIQEKPRIAIQRDLGEPYLWSKITNDFQIAHFDRTMIPSFIVALAAVIDSGKLKIGKV